MKYIRFEAENETLYGILDGEVITKLSGNFIDGNPKKLDQTYALSEVKVLPPVEPKQLVVIGLNYEKHAIEQGKEIPEEPMMFMVSPSAVIASNEKIKLPTLDHRIDYEAELAIVIGKEAYQVNKESALDYVFGYTCVNDVSDRDLQKQDKQFTRAKSFKTFKPVGPCVETELDPNNANIKLTLNGEVKQNSNTNDLIHPIEKVIATITDVMTLNPGDVILTGTPSGVSPLSPGDKVEIEIEGIGKLRNEVTG
jgi:2-keto-4-pentenoate hydratase/2-oxohepta-3-ene-1,7-dioic acid hydratase in catechol pathway